MEMATSLGNSVCTVRAQCNGSLLVNARAIDVNVENKAVTNGIGPFTYRAKFNSTEPSVLSSSLSGDNVEMESLIVMSYAAV